MTNSFISFRDDCMHIVQPFSLAGPPFQFPLSLLPNPLPLMRGILSGLGGPWEIGSANSNDSDPSK